MRSCPGMRRIRQWLGMAEFPAGHFYSPVVNVDEIQGDEKRIWPEVLSPAGFDFRDEAQLELLRGPFAQFMPRFDYSKVLESRRQDGRFYVDNSQFSHLDCRALFVILQWLRPKRMIEIGSGYSSLLAADVNTRFLGGGMNFTCIEPYPRAFLRDGVKGIGRLIEKRLQDADLGLFGQLEAGDVLFVDSSHVSKTGSDVNVIFFEILPCLRPGVFVHFHDIFLPRDYPKEWVMGRARSWNEQYLLRAFLMNNCDFEAVFACHYIASKYPEAVAPYCSDPGGGVSFWIRKRCDG